MNERKILHSLEETRVCAKEFVKNISPKEDEATVVGLYGNLGAGKTSFTQGVAHALGISDTVASPTFVIMKIYEIPAQIELPASYFKHLIHIDAYRLEKSEEMLRLGWREILSDQKNLILVEWPEQITDIMPPHIHVKLEARSPEEREVEIISL